jgi:tRNA A37 methylthiotransferase MiaB
MACLSAVLKINQIKKQYNNTMKKIILLATIAITVSTLAQIVPVSHFERMINKTHNLHGSQSTLKVISSNPKKRLDSAVDVYAKTEFTYDILELNSFSNFL